MIRKLVLVGVSIVTLVLVSYGATVRIPTHLNAVGIEEDSTGVVCLNETTGNPESCGGAGGGGGGGAVTEADGANVTLGSKADAKSTATDTTAITLMSAAKQISASVQAAAASLSGSLTVGTHAVTQSGTWTVQPGNTANTTAWKVDGSAVTQPASLVSTTTGGCTPYHLLSAASNNATLVSTGAHTLCFVSAINTTGTIYYIKFFNQVAAPSTCATDAANVVLNFPIPASTAGAGFTIPLSPFGAAFGTGLAFCITGAQADNDNTSAATGINLNIGYK